MAYAQKTGLGTSENELAQKEFMTQTGLRDLLLKIIIAGRPGRWARCTSRVRKQSGPPGPQ